MQQQEFKLNAQQWSLYNLNDVEVQKVADNLKKAKNLTSLSIVRMLDNSPNLFSPNLDVWKIKNDSGFGLQGGLAILKAAKKHPTLKFLNLQGNNIMGEGIPEAIKKLLEKTKSLKMLVLSDCGLTNKGLETISEGIKVNQSLKTIQIFDNGLITGIEHLRNVASLRNPPLNIL